MSTEGTLCAGNSPGSPLGRCCGSTCEDVFSPAPGGDCFACGYACPAGSLCTGTGCSPSVACSTAELGKSCQTSDAGVGSCCADGCKRLDPANCGGCGVACPAGQECAQSAEGALTCAYVDGGPGACENSTGVSLCPSNDTCDYYTGACEPSGCTGSALGASCGFFGSGATTDYCCASGCVDVTTDVANCGGCGVACPMGSGCSNGSCVPCGATSLGAPCSTGTSVGSCCDGYCAEMTSDPANCGGCGISCTSGELCSNGCYGAVSNTCISVTCPSGEDCVLTSWSQSTNCVRTSCAVQPDNYPCALSGHQLGTCCGEQCVDLNQSTPNCGACGNPCPSGEFCNQGYCYPDPVCSSSFSSTVCPLDGGGLGACCAAGCADFSADPVNCGGCGNVCPEASLCQGGACVEVDGGPTTCATSTCPSGTGCVASSGFCLPTTCTLGGAQCATGGGGSGTCCNGACVEAYDTNANCGYCGNACFGGTFCAGYYCTAVVTCSMSTSSEACPLDGGIGNCCSNGCAATLHDSENCGGCGLICPLGSTCRSGYCSTDAGSYPYCFAGTSSCPPGSGCDSSGRCLTTTCPVDGNPCIDDGGTDGTCCGGGCSNLLTDSTNCGACGAACDGGLFCTEGACQPIPTCSAQSVGALCPLGSGATGSCCPSGCTTTATDPLNCGGCGLVCPTGSSCSNSTCLTNTGNYASCSTDAGCATGYGCDYSVCLLSGCDAGSDGEACGLPYPTLQGLCCGGTCIDPTQNTSDCGVCGTSCGNREVCTASYGCEAAAQTCTSADVGRYCSRGPNETGSCCSNGCADLLSDPHNCGYCGQDCAQYNLTSPACCEGQCVDLNSSNYDCGTCGTPCLATQFCSSGTCR